MCELRKRTLQLMMCGRSNAVMYGGWTCQVAHYEEHKAKCQCTASKAGSKKIKSVCNLVRQLLKIASSCAWLWPRPVLNRGVIKPSTALLRRWLSSSKGEATSIRRSWTSQFKKKFESRSQSNHIIIFCSMVSIYTDTAVQSACRIQKETIYFSVTMEDPLKSFD